MFDMDKDASLTVRLPTSLRKAFENEAARQKRTMSALVVLVLTEWVERNTGTRAKGGR